MRKIAAERNYRLMKEAAPAKGHPSDKWEWYEKILAEVQSNGQRLAAIEAKLSGPEPAPAGQQAAPSVAANPLGPQPAP